MIKPVNIFWFRRDLRLHDNAGLYYALSSGLPVIPIFIFDTGILTELDRDDARISFIYQELSIIHERLKKTGSGLMIIKGEPLTIWKKLISEFTLVEVFANHDYEPYSIKRDSQIKKLLQTRNIAFRTFKDHVIFEKNEVIKEDGKPYTIYTPYMNKWMKKFQEIGLQPFDSAGHLNRMAILPELKFPDLAEIGFVKSKINVPAIRSGYNLIENYEKTRDFPSKDGTSHAGPHLRFGTVSVRELVKIADSFSNKTYLKELIWREFFMQILWHFPNVVSESFKPVYDNIEWINNEEHYRRWCIGKTGYPMVDAGMRELNATGFMHNRVRMVAASFLCKHLLIDGRWGEAFFARKLLDYELSSNNGNWQWAAGTGCDAVPYFRIFNPSEQFKKFDPEMKYVRVWIPEWGTKVYPQPLVDHRFARERALKAYKKALNEGK